MTTKPNITILNKTRTKISDETNYDVCTVTFEVDKDIKIWEARAGGDGHGSGLLVGTNENELFGFSDQNGVVETSTSEGFGGGIFYPVISSGTDIQFNIDDEELTNGDKEYKINIYAKDLDGLWTEYYT